MCESSFGDGGRGVNVKKGRTGDKASPWNVFVPEIEPCLSGEGEGGPRTLRCLAFQSTMGFPAHLLCSAGETDLLRLVIECRLLFLHQP